MNSKHPKRNFVFAKRIVAVIDLAGFTKAFHHRARREPDILLGRGPGIRISEPLYRALPSAMRSPWTKHKPPAIYHLGPTEGIYEGLGKSPDANAARW